MKRAMRWMIGVMMLVGLMVGCTVSPEWDREVGPQVAAKVRRQMGVYSDPKSAVDAYVRQVGNRLVFANPDSQFEFTFEVVDEPLPNAFAAPGGYIFITRGLLITLNSEAELANVLGHEMAHVDERHAAKRMTTGFIPALLALPGHTISIVSPAVGDLMASPFEDIGAVVLAAHSRQGERDADAIGQILAARAGYDPAALTDFLQTMQKIERIQHGQPRKGSFLDTHPLFAERIDSTRTLVGTIEQQPIKPIAPTRDAFLKRIAGIIIGANPQEGVFAGSRFIHPDAGITILMPEGWHYYNSRYAVAAVSQKRDAFLFYDRPVKGDSPAAFAGPVREEFRKAGLKPDIDQSMVINGLPAYRVGAHVGQAEGQPYYLDVTWLNVGDLVYRQVSLAPHGKRNTMHATVETFRRTMPAERNSVTVTRLRIVHAKQGETAQHIALRIPAIKWNAQIIAAINDINRDQPLSDGYPLKVAVQEQYEPGAWAPAQ